MPLKSWFWVVLLFNNFQLVSFLSDVLQAFHVLLIFPIRAIEPNDKIK